MQTLSSEANTSSQSQLLPCGPKLQTVRQREWPYHFENASNSHPALKVAATDPCPDIVFFNALRSVVVIIELTVCYELSFQAARQRKEAK